jgi:hypothetical protein
MSVEIEYEDRVSEELKISDILIHPTPLSGREMVGGEHVAQ